MPNQYSVHHLDSFHSSFAQLKRDLSLPTPIFNTKQTNLLDLKTQLDPHGLSSSTSRTEILLSPLVIKSLCAQPGSNASVKAIAISLPSRCQRGLSNTQISNSLITNHYVTDCSPHQQSFFRRRQEVDTLQKVRSIDSRLHVDADKEEAILGVARATLF